MIGKIVPLFADTSMLNSPDPETDPVHRVLPLPSEIVIVVHEEPSPLIGVVCAFQF